MEIKSLVNAFLKNITAESLLQHLSKASVYEVWAWEVLFNAVEIKKKADFLFLEERLTTKAADFQKVNPYEVDFGIPETLAEEGVCPCFKQSLITEAFRLGLFPMSITLWETDFLTIRHHTVKNIITFDRLHIPKNTARYIRNDFPDYTMTFNKDFRACLSALTETYKETWLVPELIAAFEAIHANPTRFVSVDSVEIWNERGDLVAGEVGFITGNVYASLSGFHKMPNIGTVQMSLLGLYLKQNGFAYWDLGMSLPYKYRYGAADFGRERQAELWLTRKRKRSVLSGEKKKLIDMWNGLITKHPTK